MSTREMEKGLNLESLKEVFCPCCHENVYFFWFNFFLLSVTVVHLSVKESLHSTGLQKKNKGQTHVTVITTLHKVTVTTTGQLALLALCIYTT